MTPAELIAAQQAVQAVHAVGRAARLPAGADRTPPARARWFVEGLSPRAGIAVLRAARARALLGGRDYVAPDDVQTCCRRPIAHRLVPVAGAGRGRVEQVRAMIEAVPLP